MITKRRDEPSPHSTSAATHRKAQPSTSAFHVSFHMTLPTDQAPIAFVGASDWRRPSAPSHPHLQSKRQDGFRRHPTTVVLLSAARVCSPSDRLPQSVQPPIYPLRKLLAEAARCPHDARSRRVRLPRPPVRRLPCFTVRFLSDSTTSTLLISFALACVRSLCPILSLAGHPN